jgi:hypothetical protein
MEKSIPDVNCASLLDTVNQARVIVYEAQLSLLQRGFRI